VGVKPRRALSPDPRGGRTVAGRDKPVRGYSDDFLTDPKLVRALGPFDLDVSASVNQPWDTARVMWTKDDDGLSRDWSFARMVWANPPYGPELYDWLDRLADHGSGIALVFARTDTAGFHRAVWDRADALYFFRGRLWFYKPVTGERFSENAGSPSVAVAYGKEAVKRLQRLQKPGSPYSGRLVSLR
jgi:hypothetical protein